MTKEQGTLPYHTETMQNRSLSTVIVTGRIGIVDAGLIRYFEGIKERADQLLVHVTGSRYPDIIPKTYIEEFIAALSMVNGLLESPDIKQVTGQENSSLIHLPEGKLHQYTLERVMKGMGCEKDGRENEKIPPGAGKLVDVAELVRRYGNSPYKRRVKLGLVSGSFDLIHLGHVRYIRRAKVLVDVLVVAIMSTNSLKHQEKNVQGDRPVYSQEDRLKVISSLRDVNHVVVFEEPDCKELIRAIRPNLFIKNEKDMQRPVVREECELVGILGGEVAIAQDNASYSSTEILKYIRKMNGGTEGHARFTP